MSVLSIKNFSLLLLSVLFIFVATNIKTSLRETNSNHSIKDLPPLYLPKVEAVRLISLGYNQTFSNIFWFSTLNYFGTKFKAKESMPWFSNMCDVVTSLDPKAKHVFEFCATLLSWIGKDVESSNKILDKGIKEDPNYWKYFYLRGFNNWYFKDNLEKAGEDLKISSNLPYAPASIASLASSVLSSGNNPQSVISFLENSIFATSDVLAKDALREKLKLAIVRRDVIELNNKNNEQNIHNLKDPWGEDYFYDNNLKSFISKKGGEGLIFKGKTIRTGALKTEWSNE